MNQVKDKKILLVEDEPELLKMLETILKKDGFHQIFGASTAREALSLAAKYRPDAAVLDVMLPDGDGFSLLGEIKKIRDIPVLFLTARGEAEDKILGLGLGADDYIVKPFHPREFTLRLGAVLKRTYANTIKSEVPVLYLPACVIDLGRAEVTKGGETFVLTAKEHAILTALCRNANRVVTTDTLCQCAWGDDSYGYENTLMVHIRHIREKIESNPSEPAALLTVKGLGYKLVV